ncbi:hypothetical protein [Flavivirga jejuensis]|uniref:Uncharacterized protein n=1 Tax=Flavivirga jejuensis TaxID=870487 RepID=A0ABT8WVR0_9FLAO|nr:hypothetical protein [Flavivirga jejuensis]MDO5977095.1 hypothetical protein [Flavivirga jejuensis]
MITSEKLNHHALIFFKQFKNAVKDSRDFERDALAYVRKEEAFQYKDKVSGDTLVMILEDLGYLKYELGTKRKHIITLEGFEFLKSK